MEKSIKRYFPVFLGPTFLAFLIGFIAPFLMGIYLSFCDFRTVFFMPNLIGGIVLGYVWQLIFKIGRAHV